MIEETLRPGTVWKRPPNLEDVYLKLTGRGLDVNGLPSGLQTQKQTQAQLRDSNESRELHETHRFDLGYPLRLAPVF